MRRSRIFSQANTRTDENIFRMNSTAFNLFKGAMENYGLITYREERSIIDENNTPYNQRLTSMLTIAHEMGNYEFCT